MNVGLKECKRLPRSPSPPPLNTRPVTGHTQHRGVPTEQLETRKDSPARNIHTGKARKKSSDEGEESSSDTESQHAKLVSPPRSPSPIRSASETDKEVEITTALIPKSNTDIAKIGEDVFSAKETPAGKELEQEDGKEDHTESCDTAEEGEEKNHLKMASPPKSPSLVSSAETEPMDAVNQGIVNMKSGARRDGANVKESENGAPKNLIPEDHNKQHGATTEDESSDDDETETKVTRLASPPRSPSPIRSPVETSKSRKVNKGSPKGVGANSEDEQKDDSSDEDESSEDEEETERKRAARMVSPPRPPSPVRSQASEHTSETIPSDSAAGLPYTETQKGHLQNSDENDSEEEDDTGHKQIRSAYPQRSPSPVRSSEVESTNSTVREVMLETSDEKDNMSVQGFSQQEESSECEETEETVARLSSPPRSPFPIRSPEDHTVSEPASQEQQMNDSDEESAEDVGK